MLLLANLSNMTKRKLIDHGYNLGFISRTQPQGNVRIHSGYIETGNGYSAFVNIYHYPKNHLPAFWLSRLVNQPHVIALLSVGTQNIAAVRPQLDRAISEQETQIEDKNLRPTEHMGAAYNTQALMQMYQSIKNNSETLKKVNLRLLVYDSTYEGLMHRIDDLKNNFYAFRMGRFIDEQEYDLRSVYLPISMQEKMPNNRKGKVIESYDLGGSYMFDYVNLNDPGGHYFGYTETNGAFIFNPYNLKDNQRTRVFSIVAGNAGMGKSTFLQMLNDDAFMRGNYVRNFDVSGEYRQSIRKQHGLIIDTSKEGNRVNMFEIFPTVTDADGNIDEIGSFNQNISKIKAIIHIMNSGLTRNDLNLLTVELNNFYIDRGMWTKNPQGNPDKVKVLGLAHNQYPTVTEFIIYLKDRYGVISNGNGKHKTSKEDIKSIRELIYAFSTLKTNYGGIFDGHTNIRDFNNEKVVDFDMSNAQKSSAGSEAQLFQAQFFSYLSMISSQVIINGEKYRRLIREHKFVDDKLGFNVPYYYINIDEGQNYFNPHYPDVVGMLARMMEQMRKNFCAITLAFPTLKDILLNDQNQSSQNSDYESYHASVKKIFGLMQYFHLFQLPDDDIDSLKKFFKKNRSVSLEQLDTLQNLDKHQLLTVIVGDRSYRWTTELTDAQLDRYR